MSAPDSKLRTGIGEDLGFSHRRPPVLVLPPAREASSTSADGDDIDLRDAT